MRLLRSTCGGSRTLAVYMFGQFECEFELECELEPEFDCVVVDDDPDEDGDFPLAAFAIAAPPTASAATTTTAASVFCMRVTIDHLPSRARPFESTATACENAGSGRKSS